MTTFDDIFKTSDDVGAANRIAAFLAFDETQGNTPPAPFDLVILAGNAILTTAAGAFDLAQKFDLPVLITGGIGHSTRLLAEAVRSHPTYATIATDGRSEAGILAEIALKHWRLTPERIIVETQSTNCGENAIFTLRRLDEIGRRPRRAVLIQDPLMQRRTDASFTRAWTQSRWPTAFLNWPVIVPQLVMRDGIVDFDSRLPPGLWAPNRYVSLLMGEIPRLRDDENGYGPRGHGFIDHVDIPDDVRAAHAHLSRALEDHPALRSR